MEYFYAQFTREKQYLHNVSPATVEGYQWAWKAFAPVLAGRASVTRADSASHVAELHGRGLSPVTINTYLRSLNTFFRWMNEEGHPDVPLPIPRLKEPEKVYQQFSNEQLGRYPSWMSPNCPFELKGREVWAEHDGEAADSAHFFAHKSEHDACVLAAPRSGPYGGVYRNPLVFSGSVVGAAGLEPATLCLEGRCSIHLSYAPVEAFSLILNHF